MAYKLIDNFYCNNFLLIILIMKLSYNNKKTHKSNCINMLTYDKYFKFIYLLILLKKIHVDIQ